MAGYNPFTVMTIFLSLNSLNSVKTFRENLNDIFKFALKFFQLVAIIFVGSFTQMPTILILCIS